MDFYAVEAGLVNGILRRLPVQACVILDLGDSKLVRNVGGALERDGRWRDELEGGVFRLQLGE